MDRINGAGHVNHLFVAENAATSQPPTEITAEWLNTIQEELANLAEAGGVVLSAGNRAQVLQGLMNMFAPKNMDFGSLP